MIYLFHVQFHLKLQLDAEAFYKKFKKDDYIRVLRWEKIDACKFAADVESYPLLQEHLASANKTLNGMIHKCPYKEFHIDGITISSQTAETKLSSIFPSGYIRIDITFRNRSKKSIGSVQYTFEQNFV